MNIKWIIYRIFFETKYNMSSNKIDQCSESNAIHCMFTLEKLEMKNSIGTLTMQNTYCCAAANIQAKPG